MSLDQGPGRFVRWRQRACLVVAIVLASVAAAGAVRSDDLANDGDGDGLADCREAAGLSATSGDALWTTDPDDPDTDGDGILDGDELRSADPASGGLTHLEGLWACSSTRYVALSDPTKGDSDEDGLDDSIELSDGSDPYADDADDDGLLDADEREWGSDPFRADTDGDGFDDGADIADGFTPVVLDEEIDDEEWHSEYLEGVGLGDIEEIDSVPQLLGALSPGVAGGVPVVGWVVSAIADVRDAIANVVKGDWAAVLASTAAVLPYAGDSVRASLLITTFAAKHPEQVRRLVQGILALENVPSSIRATLVRSVEPQGVDGLRRFDVSDEVIMSLAQRGASLAQTSKAFVRAGKIVVGIAGSQVDDDGFVASLEDAQDALREYSAETDESTDVTGPIYLGGLPEPEFVGGRLIDSCTACSAGPRPGHSTFRIAKLGSLYLSRSTQQQIDKDAFLVKSGFTLEWHFFAGPTGWSVSPNVMDALDDAGIDYVIHVPA